MSSSTVSAGAAPSAGHNGNTEVSHQSEDSRDADVIDEALEGRSVGVGAATDEGEGGGGNGGGSLAAAFPGGGDVAFARCGGTDGETAADVDERGGVACATPKSERKDASTSGSNDAVNPCAAASPRARCKN